MAKYSVVMAGIPFRSTQAADFERANQIVRKSAIIGNTSEDLPAIAARSRQRLITRWFQAASNWLTMARAANRHMLFDDNDSLRFIRCF
jgi:hypothetical protein